MAASSPRVFHLITRLIKGGADAKTMAAVLGLDDYEFVVGHGAEYDPDQIETLQRNGVETHRFPLIRHYNPVTPVPAVLSVARYLRRNEFDIVHTHSTEAGIIGRFAAQLAGVPNVVHTVHGVPFGDDQSTLLNRFVLGCERRAARHTDVIVTNADAIAAEYLDRGIGTPEQYATVYSGIDIETFRNADPVTLPGDGVRLLMVSRLESGKGFSVLFDAIERLDGNVHACIAGQGPIESELRAQIRDRGLSEQVHLLGYRTDVPRVMAASDVLVLPSFREGTPRAITEAMAAGLPIVATDIAGIPEQVDDGENGYLVEPGDPDALARNLRRLVQNPEKPAEMGRKSRERVKTFSMDSMLDDLERVYERVRDDTTREAQPTNRVIDHPSNRHTPGQE